MNAPLSAGSASLPKFEVVECPECDGTGRHEGDDCCHCLGEGSFKEKVRSYAIALVGGDYLKERFLTVAEAWLTFERMTSTGPGKNGRRDLHRIENLDNVDIGCPDGLSDFEREWLEEREYEQHVAAKKAVAHV